MKHLWPLLLAASCVAGADEVKVKLSLNGQHIGFGTIYQGFDSDGSFRKVMDYRFQSGDAQPMRLWVQITASKDGFTKEHVERLTTPKGLVEAKKISYTDKGARLEMVKGRDRTEQEFGWPEPNLPLIKRPFWFVKSSPKVGDEAVGLVFDSITNGWAKANYKYEGLEKLQMGRKTVKAHKIRNLTATEWLDNKGMPYRMDTPINGQMIVVERM